MYDGLWTFGGEEIVNHGRTEAYLQHGFKPAGVTISTEDPGCATLVEMVNGGEAYESPLADAAPWVESSDPDTWDFAGVIVTDITGVNGSTRSAAVTEYVGDGGGVGRARYGTRTIAVTALLVGRTGASVEAGLSWLSSALADDCGPGLGTELCGLVACPEDYLDSPIIDADPVTETLDLRVDGWAPSSGRFRSRDGWFDPDAPTVGSPAKYGSALYGFSTYAIGGPAYGESFYGEAIYGVENDVADPVLLGPEQECYAGPVTWAWNLATLRGPVTVSYGARAADGTVLSRSDAQRVQGNAALIFTPDPTWEGWVPALWVEGNPVKIAPTITHTPYKTAEQCADSYLRSYLDVGTVEGPTVVDKIAFSCGEYAMKVEWTWVVGNPFVFGSITPLVTDYSTATGLAGSVESGVRPTALTEPGTFMFGDECALTPSPPLLLVSDPLCPGFITPPEAPKIVDACWQPPQAWRRWSFSIPSRLAPANNDGLLSLSFVNDRQPKRGVRVRLYADPLSRGMAGVDECNFCAEFNLTYIPPDSTLVIDTARKSITTQVPGLDPINTAANVRGSRGAPFEFPTLQCNTGYLVLLDIPGDLGDQGDLTFAMSLRPATV